MHIRRNHTLCSRFPPPSLTARNDMDARSVGTLKKQDGRWLDCSYVGRNRDLFCHVKLKGKKEKKSYILQEMYQALGKTNR